MRVIHLIAPGMAGGAESALYSLAAAQLRAGHEVRVVALTTDAAGPHPFVAQLERDGIPVTDVRLGRRKYFAEAHAVAQIITASRADVLHTHVYHADTIGYLASRRVGVPHVATVHGFTGSGVRNSAYIALDMWLMRRCAAVICVATNVRERVLRERVDPSRIHLIPNGCAAPALMPRAEAREALGVDRYMRAIGWVGRLSREKGADLLIEALARPAASGVTAVIVGDGPERGALVMKARQLGLDGQRVRFAGRIDNASRYYAAFDALVVSSRTEATPMVVLEAMASEIPVVAFRVGGIGSMLSDDSAILVPANDTDGLARAMVRVFDAPAAAQTRAAVARNDYAERFTPQACASAVLNVYERLLPGVRAGDAPSESSAVRARETLSSPR